MAKELDPARFEVVQQGPVTLDPSRYEVVQGPTVKLPDASVLQVSPKMAPVMAEQRLPPANPNATTGDKIRAGVRGGLQGFYGGFADELAAAFEAPFSDKTYSQIRDEYRAKHEQAQRDAPMLYAGSTLIGAAKGPPVLPTGGGFIGSVGRGAAQGAASGLGHSTADLTKGDVSAAAKDTLKGGALGGVVGGAIGYPAQRIVSGAPARVDQRTFDAIGYKGTAVQRQKLGFKKRDVVTAAKEAKVDSVIDDPAAMQARAERAADKITERNRATYDAVDKAAGGIPVGRVVDALENAAASTEKSPSGLAMAGALRRMKDDVQTAWGERGAVTTRELRSEITKWQTKGYAGSQLIDPTAAKQVARDAATAAHGVLDDHMAAGAKANPALKKQVAKVQRDNKKISALIKIAEVAERRANQAQFSRRSDSIVRDVTSWARDKARSTVAPIDRAIASLVKAAQTGKAPKESINAAVKAGLSRETANRVFTTFAKQATEMAETGVPRALARAPGAAVDLATGAGEKAVQVIADPFMPSDEPY